MHLIIDTIDLMLFLAMMKRTQKIIMSSEMSIHPAELCEALAQNRIVRKLPQAKVAVRENLSCNTISCIENGDPSVAIGQSLRYIDVIRP